MQKLNYQNEKKVHFIYNYIKLVYLSTVKTKTTNKKQKNNFWGTKPIHKTKYFKTPDSNGPE